MKDLKGTKTEATLMAAFAGESQATNKYTYYASKAKKDGYVQIAQLFEETAGNEREHAKLWFKRFTAAPCQAQWRTLPTQQPAKTMSGPTCMPPSPKRHAKRDSTI